MRGKRGVLLRALSGPGLIPAHAGKTSPYRQWRNRAWAHPRSCGENAVMARTVRSSMGSSPLMRGKLLGSLLRLGRHGLIPAHTGKTRACRAEPTSTRAHPRSRGENPPPLEVPKYAMGSSPLMRGKPGRVHGVTERLGLIPTHAGKTWSATERSPSRTAHPRSRGENRESTTQKVPRAGSSPLTRGELACDTQGVDVVGLIPTHAGKTAPSQCKTCARRAHPRSRGENIASSFAFAWSLGSSPLTRGKLEFDGLQPAAVGLIPAHAEKTHWESPPARPRRVHPRSRGENANSISEPVLPNGSSPLTRGKPERRGHHAAQEGLIPAHAGKTQGRWG